MLGRFETVREPPGQAAVSAFQHFTGVTAGIARVGVQELDRRQRRDEHPVLRGVIGPFGGEAHVDVGRLTRFCGVS